VTDDDLLYLPATELRARYTAREVSPVEAVTAVIRRTESVGGHVNAFAEERFDEALAEASAAEERYRDGTARPLEGLPVALKEEQPIAGLPLREGSALLAGSIAAETHPIVPRIRAAGGIVHARTTTPEFCAAGFTQTEMWGVTRTPWNTAYSSGGSSGGSGAALAAGTTALATGSDIGGSIRIPAAFNGVVGYKPPYGRVPALHPYNLDHYCHDGPMARTVADCALLTNVIAGRHPGDPVSVPFATPIPETLAPVAGRRVALCVHLGDYPVAADVEARVREAAAALADAGAAVTEIELPWSRAELMRAAWAHYGAIFAPLVREVMAEHGDGILGYTRDFVERAEAAYRRDGFYAALRTEGRVHADLAAVFAEHDALICPTSGVPAFPAGDDLLGGRLSVDGAEWRFAHNLEVPLCVPFNMASRCPVISVPAGLAANGVPVGLQVAGRPYDDTTVFEVAAAVQAAHPWYTDPSWRPALTAA
jgi:aspartyl-tRNA(Asn)/glutamyl-tRNA(Gln) amidotransferase subunit A